MMFVATLGNIVIALNPPVSTLLSLLYSSLLLLEKKAFLITFQALFICCMCTGAHFRIAMKGAMGLYAMCTFVRISPFWVLGSRP